MLLFFSLLAAFYRLTHRAPPLFAGLRKAHVVNRCVQEKDLDNPNCSKTGSYGIGGVQIQSSIGQVRGQCVHPLLSRSDISLSGLTAIVIECDAELHLNLDPEL